MVIVNLLLKLNTYYFGPKTGHIYNNFHNYKNVQANYDININDIRWCGQLSPTCGDFIYQLAVIFMYAV